MNLSFHSQFIFRSPSLPFSKTIETGDTIRKIAQEESFQEAIYIASPTLYYELKRWLNGMLTNEKEVRKLLYSLHKYLSRMQSRCTPYGLFASLSVANWGQVNKIILENKLTRRTRLDMSFLCALAQHLSKHPSIQPHLLFYPNNSIYKIGQQLRYIEYIYSNNKRKHTISGVDASDYLEKILDGTKNGEYLSNITELLVNKIVTKEEAKNFINDVVGCQLLVSELDPTVTGEEFMYQLISILERVNRNIGEEDVLKTINLLNEVIVILKSIDKKDINEINVYSQLFELLKTLNLSLGENNLFQVDTYKGTLESELSGKIKDNLLKAIEFQQKLTSQYKNKDIENFKNRFREVYEEKEMPLLEILDTESGVGYPAKDIVGINILVDDLPARDYSEEIQLNWNGKDAILLKKIFDAHKDNNYVVILSDEDIKDLPIENSSFPITAPIKFKIIDAVNNKIELEYVGGGASAANLLGRFAYGDKRVFNIIKDIVGYEKEVLNDKVVAEIVHLPESRIGNILLRPVFRDYEIPYLAKSAVPFERQIPISDIKVSVKGNRVILRSVRLNKEILPRLSTAHNFSFDALPAYKFLSDLQLQDIDKPSLSFSWGVLSRNFKFLPRVEYCDVILSPATWNLTASDYEVLFKSILSLDLMGEVEKWKEKWKMPVYILLKDADNKLLVNLESELSVKTFLDTIKKRLSIELSEFLFDPETSLVRDVQGNPYTHEIIGILFNQEYKKQVTSQFPSKDAEYSRKIKRSFIPGSEWLYYKIYCGVKTADKILIETIKPLVEYLQRENLIEKWFFIRYADPDSHIRLRFFNKDISKIPEIIKVAYQYLNPLQQEGIISKILNDTYNREIERYGYNSIDVTEDYFTFDSQSTLILLSLTEKGKNEEIKWQYLARSIDELLNNFNYTLQDKCAFMEVLKTSSLTEHGGHKELRLYLDDKFRKLRPQLDKFLDRGHDNDSNTMPIINLQQLKNTQTIQIAQQIMNLKETNQLIISLDTLLSSYIHMSTNRIFKSKQRTYELVIYDILYRYYKSQVAKVNQKRQVIV